MKTINTKEGRFGIQEITSQNMSMITGMREGFFGG
jgi:hypothetical protein